MVESYYIICIWLVTSMAGDIVYNPLLMATPQGGPSFDRVPIYINGRSVVAGGLTDRTWQASTGSGTIRIATGSSIIDYTNTTNESWVMWSSRAYLRKVRCRVFKNSFNKRFEVFMLKNNEKYGQLQFAVQAGSTGDFAQPVTENQFLPMNQGERYAWGLFTDDNLVPTGRITLSFTSEFYFGDGLN